MAGEAALRARWLNVLRMRGRWTAAPLAPSFSRLVETGPVGIGWLDLMEQWERGRHPGEKPEAYEQYVAL